jgi:hypothetical protein
LFSSNFDAETDSRSISSFSWRVINQSKDNDDRRRKNMVELRDWTNYNSKFTLQALDAAYAPKKWSNISVSVSYNTDDDLSTITFTGYDDGEFIVRSVMSVNRRFVKKFDALDLIGHRVGSKGESSNELFGMMYYLSFYNYDNDDFSRSIGRCKGCDTGCAAGGLCLSDCWVNEFT